MHPAPARPRRTATASALEADRTGHPQAVLVVTALPLASAANALREAVEGRHVEPLLDPPPDAEAGGERLELPGAARVGVAVGEARLRGELLRGAELVHPGELERVDGREVVLDAPGEVAAVGRREHELRERLPRDGRGGVETAVDVAVL